MAILSRIKTWIAGETLTASDLNAEFNNIINNLDPDGVEDASANNGEMQATRDPFAGDAIVLALSLRHELQGLRYRAKQEHQTSQWYIFPDIVEKSAAYTATADDRIILADASGGAFSITLPAVASSADKIYYIKNVGASGTVTIDGNASETIDGVTTYALTDTYDSVIIACDGTEWFILSEIVVDAATITGTETLTNKTLTTPTIASFVNAGHDHSDAAGGGTLALDYIYIREEQTAGTHGGTFTQDAWQIRVLNTEVVDTGNDAAVASNKVTLQAGTYRFRASAPGRVCDGHKARLWNDSDSSTVAVSTSEYSPNGVDALAKAVVIGRFTIASAKDFELQHFCETTAITSGFGVASNLDSQVEVYSEIEFWKEL